MSGRLPRPSRRGPRLAGPALICGLIALLAPTTAGAIVGGEPAPPGRWPWMVAVLEADTEDAARAQFCGGVAIAPRRVLTAGHCVAGRKSRQVEVLIGRTRLTETDGRRLRVKSISLYPGFVSGAEPGLDAAVLELRSELGVAPLALAGPGDAEAWMPGSAAWTMGWGQLNARRSPGGARYYADRLRELQIPVQSDDACERAYGLGFADWPFRPEWLFCAGTGDGLVSGCHGDSGGPLVVATPGGWLDVGILLGGDDCASKGYYDIFARVDGISAFALAASPTAQPDPVGRPRITGRLAAGEQVRCTRGRWHGEPARFSFRWWRIGDSSRRVLGRGPRYRLTRREARSGVVCAVTAANRGGSNTTAARRLPG